MLGHGGRDPGYPSAPDEEPPPSAQIVFTADVLRPGSSLLPTSSCILSNPWTRTRGDNNGQFVSQMWFSGSAGASNMLNAAATSSEAEAKSLVQLNFHCVYPNLAHRLQRLR